jgi:hypothetical protein
MDDADIINISLRHYCRAGLTEISNIFIPQLKTGYCIKC